MLQKTGSGEVEPARNSGPDYSVTKARPEKTLVVTKANSSCLQPAWDQATTSSHTRITRSSTVLTRRSKVLSFLSFQSDQDTKISSCMKGMQISSSSSESLARYSASASLKIRKNYNAISIRTQQRSSHETHKTTTLLDRSIKHDTTTVDVNQCLFHYN